MMDEEEADDESEPVLRPQGVHATVNMDPRGRTYQMVPVANLTQPFQDALLEFCQVPTTQLDCKWGICGLSTRI